MYRPTLRSVAAAALGLLAGEATGCLAHHPHALQVMAAPATGCPAEAIEVAEARTVLGATLWRARCRQGAWRCAARHNFDGPTRVVCDPEPAAPAAP